MLYKLASNKIRLEKKAQLPNNGVVSNNANSQPTFQDNINTVGKGAVVGSVIGGALGALKESKGDKVARISGAMLGAHKGMLVGAGLTLGGLVVHNLLSKKKQQPTPQPIPQANNLY